MSFETVCELAQGEIGARMDAIIDAVLVLSCLKPFGESVVVNYWRWRMYTAANPLPPENVRKLAEVLTEHVEPMSKCCRELFLRPELIEADLRKLYPRVLKKLAEEGKWRDEGWRYADAQHRGAGLLEGWRAPVQDQAVGLRLQVTRQDAARRVLTRFWRGKAK